MCRAHLISVAPHTPKCCSRTPKSCSANTRELQCTHPKVMQQVQEFYYMHEKGETRVINGVRLAQHIEKLKTQPRFSKTTPLSNITGEATSFMCRGFLLAALVRLFLFCLGASYLLSRPAMGQLLAALVRILLFCIGLVTCCVGEATSVVCRSQLLAVHARLLLF